nr:MAG TPA: hypothetical protein [Caudoviricetes sp.]
MATTLKGTIWGGGVTFSASPATVSVPTGSVNFTYVGEFTIPQGVHVVKARLYGTNYYGGETSKTAFVAVTPNKKYRLMGVWPFEYSEEQTERFYADEILINNTIGGVSWIGPSVYDLSEVDNLNFTISWSPEINTHTPDVTDY